MLPQKRFLTFFEDLSLSIHLGKLPPPFSKILLILRAERVFLAYDMMLADCVWRFQRAAWDRCAVFVELVFDF